MLAVLLWEQVVLKRFSSKDFTSQDQNDFSSIASYNKKAVQFFLAVGRWKKYLNSKS